MNIAKKTLAIASISVASIISSQAALIFYEGVNSETDVFDQREFAPVNARWTTSDSSFYSVSGTGQTYPGLPTQPGGFNAPNQFGRQTTALIGQQPASGVYWLSYLVRFSATVSTGTGVSFFQGSQERNFFGVNRVPTTPPAPVGPIRWSNSIDPLSPGSPDGQFYGTANITPPSVGSSRFVVVRMDMSNPIGVYHMWVNPLLPDGVNTAQVTDSAAINGVAGTNFTPFNFDRVRIGNFDAGVPRFDEIRVATTWASVIPEPSSALLSIMGLAAAVGIRRRK